MTLNNTSPSIARALLDLQGNKQTNQGINTNYQIMGQDPNAQALDVNNPSFVEQAANETIKQANATLQPQTPSIARTLLDIQQKPKKQSPSIANAILALGKSMSQNTNQGQMINGNYVPNTTIGTSLSGVSSGLDELNQRDKAQALEQERYNQEQAFRDQGYGDSRLDRASDEDFRNRQLSSQEQRARDALNYQKEVVKQKQAVENAKLAKEEQETQRKQTEIANDYQGLRENYANVKDNLGPSIKKRLGRLWDTFIKGDTSFIDLKSDVTNTLSRFARELGAFEKGPMTDDDFKKLIEGTFNENASYEQNLQNLDSLMNSLAKNPQFTELVTQMYGGKDAIENNPYASGGREI